MIHDAVIHMVGDQPMLCDIEALPSASDACLVCTNLRLLDGKKPLSSDFIDSWFLIPLQFVRFIEIPRRSLSGADSPGQRLAPAQAEGAPLVAAESSAQRDEEDAEDVVAGEDLLRRIREV